MPEIAATLNAFESQHPRDDSSRHCEFLVKPIVIPRLLDVMRQLLNLEWTLAPAEAAAPRSEHAAGIPRMQLDQSQIEELIALGSIGYVRGIEAKLASLQASAPDSGALLKALGGYVRTFQFKRYLDTLEGLREREH